MSKEEWSEMGKGEMGPKSSPFPFKFMLENDEGKGRRIWAKLKDTVSDDNALLIIKGSAGVKGTLEVPEKNIDSPTTRGWSSAPFRLYKAYLTLRAIAADPRA